MPPRRDPDEREADRRKGPKHAERGTPPRPRQPVRRPEDEPEPDAPEGTPGPDEGQEDAEG